MCLIFTIPGFAQQRRARYNLLGYDKTGYKRIVVISDDDCRGFAWRIKNNTDTVVLNGVIGPSLTGPGKHTPKNFNHEIVFSGLTETGTFLFEIDNVSAFNINISDSPYARLANEVLRGLRVRRSGAPILFPAYRDKSKIPHDGDADAPIYCHDGSSSFRAHNWGPDPQNKTADMLGGWYDAGDYIKFTLTTAYTAYNLCLAYLLSPETFDNTQNYAAGAYCDLLDEAKHGLDYLVKTMPSQDEFIFQVADEEDHNQWPPRLPENDSLNGNRKAYSVKSKPQMFLTAAALAIGSTVFRNLDQDLADTYLHKAELIYAEARASAITSAFFAANTNDFYRDNEYRDNRTLAGTELYLATSETAYLDDARTYIQGGYWASWSGLNLKANIRLAAHDQTARNNLTWELDYFKNSLAGESGNIWRVPHSYTWGTLFSFFSVAAGALETKLIHNDEAYLQVARDVIDYTFGINNWGLGFIASQSYPGAIRTSYAAYYRKTSDGSMRDDVFPTGEIAEGPAEASQHNPMRQYFWPSHNENLKIRESNDLFRDFNTGSVVYFEMPGDFVCSETTIGGLSDCVLLLALADKAFTGGQTNIPPTAAITDPADKATFSQGDNILIKALANDSDGSVAKVEFYRNGQKTGEDTIAPYEYLWANAENGKYQLTVKAVDDKGAAGISAAVNIEVIKTGNELPTAEIITPVNGQKFYEGDPVVLDINASDSDGRIARVEYYVDSLLLGEILSLPFTASLQNLAVGSRQVTAMAVDDQGAVSAPDTVTINIEKKSSGAAVKAEFKVVSGPWGNGYNAEIKITNIGSETINGWEIVFDFASIINSMWWTGSWSKNGSRYQAASPNGWNSTMDPNGSVAFQFNVTGPVVQPVGVTFNGQSFDFEP